MQFQNDKTLKDKDKALKQLKIQRDCLNVEIQELKQESEKLPKPEIKLYSEAIARPKPVNFGSFKKPMQLGFSATQSINNPFLKKSRDFDKSIMSEDE